METNIVFGAWRGTDVAVPQRNLAEHGDRRLMVAARATRVAEESPCQSAVPRGDVRHAGSDESGTSERDG
eukprot:959672-Prymnesium_polylepis.1